MLITSQAGQISNVALKEKNQNLMIEANQIRPQTMGSIRQKSEMLVQKLKASRSRDQGIKINDLIK